ncbi:MAG: alpha/beta hydrolase [Kiritimatiellaeota bacterium]|nr:alpha/beta hydrolase [Kiritimatiellota bacterium]
MFVLLKVNDAMFHPFEPDYSWEMPNIVNIGDAEAPISAIWLPNAETNKVFLYSYGNAENIGDLASVFEAFAKAGLSVLAYDYPGYGLSAGKPTEKGAYASAEAAYRFLTERCGITPSAIIVLGRSLGSGAACYLAEKFPVGGLVIESGFTSAPRVVTRIRILPFDPFPNIRRIGNIPCPKLFIHGTEDDTIAFSHGKAMFAAAREPKEHLWVDGAGHDDLTVVLGNEKYVAVLNAFANRIQKELK